MGEILIRDGEREIRSFLTDWKGTIIVEVDDQGTPTLVVSTDAPFEAADVEVSEQEIKPEHKGVLGGSYWLLVAPTIAGLVSVLLVVSGVATVDSPGGISHLPAVCFLFTLLIAGTTDLWIYNDARHLASMGAEWQPDPWRYFLAGGLLLTGGGVLWNGVATMVQTRLLALVGLSIASFAMAPVVIGPVYLYNRYRRIGLT